MLRFSERQLSAICNLRTNPDFKIVLEALADYGEELLKELVFARDDKDTAQGMARSVTLVLQSITEAPQALEKIRQPQT